MSNTYQKNRLRAQPDPVAGEVAVPEQVIVSMAEIAGAAREGLLALAVSTGLQVMTAMFDEDVARLCGPGGKHNPDRAGYRDGTEAGSVTLGGRRLAVTRPRVRAADGAGELRLPSYDPFSSTEVLGRLARENMLAGLSSRPLPPRDRARRAGHRGAGCLHLEVGGLPPVRGHHRDRAGRADDPSAGRAGPGRAHGRRGALQRAHLRRSARHRHRRGQVPAGPASRPSKIISNKAVVHPLEAHFTENVIAISNNEDQKVA